MKRRIVCLLALSLLAVACQMPASRPALPSSTPGTPGSDPLQAAWDDRSVFRAGLVTADQAVLDKLASASTYHLELVIQGDLLHIAGNEEVRYTNNEKGPLTDVRFRLFPNVLAGDMRVTDVQVEGQSADPGLSMMQSVLTVPLPRPLEPGRSVTISMGFSVRVPDTVEKNYGVLASAEGVLSLAHAYPVIPVYDERGWEAELPPPAGDITFTDMSFFVVRVTAPKNLTLVAVGRELDRSQAGETQTVTYAAGPVRDFYLAASKDYRAFSRKTGETTVNFYAPPAQQAGAQAGLNTAIRALEDFGQRYAPYPYSELDIVETPTLALGIEYPGMLAIADRIMGPNDPYLEATVAHEVGHQWFYNLVGSNQLDQPWLDESLTQFATLQYFTDRYGSQGAAGFRDSLYARWDRVDRAPIPIGLPVSGYSDVGYGAIVYGRGPLFFEALKGRLGADRFDEFLRDYTAFYSWGIATPEGLKALAEERCTCDLTVLFRAWVYP